MLNQILLSNMVIITFVYGLTFFLIGVVIQLKYIKDSSFKIAFSLRWIARFGIIHGFAEWGDVFIPIQAGYLPADTIFLMRILKMSMCTLSFTMLICFSLELGMKTLGGSKSLNKRLLAIVPSFMFLFWTLLIVVNYQTLGKYEPEHWLKHGEILARYTFGLSGALFSGIVLFLQKTELNRLKNAEVIKNLIGASMSMMLYSLATGLIVPPAESFILASSVNTTWFFATFHFPVQILRTLCGIIILYNVVGLLKVVDWEKHNRLDEVERKQAVLQERERFARDLHDGIIQSLYAIGLNIENSMFLTRENTVQAQDTLSEVMNKLNGIINKIRAYILNLRPIQLQNLDLSQQLANLVNEFKANSLIEAHLTLEDKQAITELSPFQVEQLYLIVQEALSNILRHASATSAEIQLVLNKNLLCLSIKDNGKGFNRLDHMSENKGEQYGLDNMAKRAQILGGNLQIVSSEGHGTKIEASIPFIGGVV